MKFFNNRINVNGASKTFDDIISEVAGGMKKQASVAEPLSKEAKNPKDELPDFIKNKMKKGKGNKGKKGEVPPQLVPFVKGKGNKKASSAELVKIADVVKVSDDEVILVLAEGMDAEGMDAEGMGAEAVEIEDDATDEAMMEAMNNVAVEAIGSSEGESCEACGTAMASSDEPVEAGWSDKSASASPKFVKIANLTDKQKGKFRSYWSNVWPKDFIDAVLDTEN
jgi:hypothetical protein